jgi:hypothetical protein
MAKYYNGINGPFRGKVGTVAGCKWKSEHYMRSTGFERTKNISDKEKDNRSHFTVAHMWLKPLTPFLRVGFKGYTPLVEGFTAAKSHLMRNAMEGNAIHPDLVRVSSGTLANPENFRVEVAGDNLVFNWDVSAGEDAHPRDQVMLMAYDIADKSAYMVSAGGFRESGMELINIKYHSPGSRLELYIAFNSWDRSRQSNSEYLGFVEI